MPGRRCQANSRSIYIDLGVNWCNTLHLWRRVAPWRAHEPWLVVGWEAAPLIAPFAERCMHELAHGRPLPDLGIPMTGSTDELARFVARTPDIKQCFSAKPNRSIGLASNADAMKACILADDAFRRNLSAAVVEAPSLSNNQELLDSRLQMVRTWCPRINADARGAREHGESERSHYSYTLIPAAAGPANGTLTLTGGIEQMLMGGGRPLWMGVGGTYSPPHHLKPLSRYAY